MEKRSASPNGPSVTAVGLGCMGMSEFYGASDDARSVEVIHHALDRGVTLLDTADMYGAGKNERLIGRALKTRRAEAFLCTKFAVRRGDDGSWLGISGRPEYVAAACDASLARLGVEHIDLYYQHRVDPQVPIEETIGAMAALVKAGKVRWLGMSEAAPETLRRAAKVHPIAALQTELSLWSREPETELLAACRELGVLFVAYSPLGRGFLTGQLRSVADLAADDFRRNLPRFSEEHFAKNLTLVQAVEALAARKGCTAAQLALAWVLGRGDHVVAIPGTRSAGRVDENAAAAAVTLSPEDCAALDAIMPPGAAEGTRYSAPGMASVDR
ncbi:MAG: aldo/keto reductase [Polyangiaceae bacterium]|nr:aldo/keto reductase [Polyangiaceae bacterium]